MNEVVEKLIESDIPQKNGIILICEKCGKKMAKDENPSQVLQQALKEELKSCLPPKSWKAVLTTCLSICPENRITIAEVNFKDNTSKFYTIDGKLTVEDKIIIIKENVINNSLINE